MNCTSRLLWCRQTFIGTSSVRVLVTAAITWHFVMSTLVVATLLSGNSSMIFLVALSWFFAMKTSMPQRPRTQLDATKKPLNKSGIIPKIDAHKKPCAFEKNRVAGTCVGVHSYHVCLNIPKFSEKSTGLAEIFWVYRCIGIAGKQSPICLGPLFDRLYSARRDNVSLSTYLHCNINASLLKFVFFVNSPVQQIFLASDVESALIFSSTSPSVPWSFRFSADEAFRVIRLTRLGRFWNIYWKWLHHISCVKLFFQRWEVLPWYYRLGGKSHNDLISS